MSALLTSLVGVLGVVVGALLGFFFRVRGDRHQIRYTRLYERRAEVLAKLSELLFSAQRDFQSWTSPVGSVGGPSKADKMQTAAVRYDELARRDYDDQGTPTHDHAGTLRDQDAPAFGEQLRELL